MLTLDLERNDLFSPYMDAVSSVQCKLALSAARDVLFLAHCDLPGERIVWVGLVAYKMDSSRHTLQRLPGIEIHIALSRMLIDLC